MSNLINAVSNLNTEAKKTALRGLANSSLFKLVGQTFAQVMAEESSAARQTTMRSVNSSVARGIFDNERTERDAPYGLAPQMNRDERLHGLAAIYVEAAQACEALSETPYDLAMLPEDAFDLMSTPNTGRVQHEFAKLMSEELGIPLKQAVEKVTQQQQENAETMKARRDKVLAAVEGLLTESGSEYAERCMNQLLDADEAILAEKIGNALNNAIDRTTQAAIRYNSVSLLTTVKLLKEGLAEFDRYAKQVFTKHVGEDIAV